MAILLASCGPPPEDDLQNSEHELYASAHWKWADPLIHVCWIRPTPGRARERAWVREAVRSTWETHSKVRFWGWGECSRGSARGIQILVSQERPRSFVGRISAERWPSLWLNFDFTKWGQSCRGARRESCIRSIAVHEFGHALGFYHEQDRPDTPRRCLDQLRDDDVRERGDGVLLTGWDEDSVLNYCSDEWINGGRLSARDIRGLQRHYGPR